MTGARSWLRSLDARDRIELGLALATAVVHVLPLERFYPELAEIILIAGAWVGYLVWLAVRDRDRLRAMGFRREGAKESAVRAGAWLVAATLAMAIWAARAGTLGLHAHMLILAALYPIWGWVQQWLVLGIFARQVDRAASVPVTTLLTAALFGLLHLPDVLLAVGTTLLGLALTPIYLRYRNLWPLGVMHGWLAIPTYFWIRGVDPWARVID